MNKKSIVPEPPDSDCEDKDELRARFTGWLEQTLYRAKLKYIKKNRQQMIIVSLEELQEEVIVDPADRFTYIERSLTDFDFEEADSFFDRDGNEHIVDDDGYCEDCDDYHDDW